MSEKLQKLIQNEGWELIQTEEGISVAAYGQRFKLRHPCLIHLKLYREEVNPEQKYLHMKAAHDYLWPQYVKTWHRWTEERFRAHCDDYNYIALAGGASTAKSLDSAKIAVLFWLANPKNRGVVIASTTLESLSNRIWGYATNLLSKMVIKIPFQYIGGNSPKVLFPSDKSSTEIRDTIHGMFAVAAKSGSDERTISSIIGRHPQDKLLVILDEATDMPSALVKSFANLDSGDAKFQCIAIGNSNSTDDLHGALSTPLATWEKIDPLKDTRWETTQKKGICLFFSCYDSPAIHETDFEKKRLLSKFLITKEQIEAKKMELGEQSDQFYRFVLGFWRHKSTEDVIASKQFIETFGTAARAHFGGITPINLVGGLDIAYGGDQCLLRLGVLGVDVNGLYVLDFREDELIFPIQIMRNSTDSADIQIAKGVLARLKEFNIPLNHVAIDATGQGRAMGGVLQLLDNQMKRPISIYSTKTGINQENSWDVVIKTSYELWFTVRDFIQASQIRGLGNKTIMQLSERQIVRTANGKQALESKADYKKRIGAKYPGMAHSPDHADAAALTVQSAIINFGFSIGKKRTLPVVTNFNQSKWLEYQAERQMQAKEEKKHIYSPVATFSAGIESLAKRKIL